MPDGMSQAAIIHNSSFIIKKYGFQVRAITVQRFFNKTPETTFFPHIFAKKLKFYYDGRFESNGRIAGKPYDQGSQ